MGESEESQDTFGIEQSNAASDDDAEKEEGLDHGRCRRPSTALM